MADFEDAHAEHFASALTELFPDMPSLDSHIGAVLAHDAQAAMERRPVLRVVHDKED